MTQLLRCFVLLAVLSGKSLAFNTCITQKQGECIHPDNECRPGYAEHRPFSNYIGCSSVFLSKCCVRVEPVVPDRGNCGRGTDFATDRVLNGIETGPCNWPYVVSIRSSQSGATSGTLSLSTTIHACGGVLISPQWVLTSAFCLLSAGDSVANAPNRILVVAGEYNISGTEIFPVDGKPQEQTFRVQRAIINPNHRFREASQITFGDPVAINDHGIALIKLDRMVVPKRCAAPACLPTLEESQARNLFYDDCRILGWGFTRSGSQVPAVGALDILKQSATNIVSPAACDYLTEVFNFRPNRPAGSSCRASPKRNTDNCLGDEGGPVLCASGGQWVVRGIQPLNMCVNDSFSLYITDVAPYVQWIRDIMARFANV